MHANPECIARASEREYLLNYEKRSISIQDWPRQFDVRPNQIGAAKLKRDLLEDTCRLQFGAAISSPLHRLSIQLARLNDTVRLQQLDVDVVNLEWRATVIDYGDILQQETLKIASAFQRVGSSC